MAIKIMTILAVPFVALVLLFAAGLLLVGSIWQDAMRWVKELQYR